MGGKREVEACRRGRGGEYQIFVTFPIMKVSGNFGILLKINLCVFRRVVHNFS